MKRSVVTALCAGIAALAVIGTAGAPQNVPRPPVSAQGVPKAPALPETPQGSAGTKVDNCSLAPISAKELEAVRGVILGFLEKREKARDDFVKAEAIVPQDCLRARAVFYLRVLAVVKSLG
jgi:hypothetical protein